MTSLPKPPSLLLVGGGLQNALITLAALEADPEAHLLVLERGDRPCGNHTWSFHDSDVPAPLRPVLDRIGPARWADYDVRFPGGSRRVELGYGSVASEDLAEHWTARMAAAPNATLRLNAEVTAIDAEGVTLADSERLTGELVVDARGPEMPTDARVGYQKFVGLELQLGMPHDLERPVLMDATIEQEDGFRFLYLLPFAPDRLLVEDTVFSTNPDLPVELYRDRVLAEAEARGWVPARILREEDGVLPMPWAGPGPTLQTEGPLRAGFRGGWFHPATGYSMPHAMRLATIVSRHLDDAATLFATDDYKRFVSRERKQARFARFLNRLLFTGLAPENRWTVFERFYRLPESVIARFYACALTPLDRARLLVGRPPRGFSVRSALAGSALR